MNTTETTFNAEKYDKYNMNWSEILEGWKNGDFSRQDIANYATKSLQEGTENYLSLTDLVEHYDLTNADITAILNSLVKQATLGHCYM